MALIKPRVITARAADAPCPKTTRLAGNLGPRTGAAVAQRLLLPPYPPQSQNPPRHHPQLFERGGLEAAVGLVDGFARAADTSLQGSYKGNTDDFALCP